MQSTKMMTLNSKRNSQLYNLGKDVVGTHVQFDDSRPGGRIFRVVRPFFKLIIIRSIMRLCIACVSTPKLGGSGGMLPQKKFAISNHPDSFWWPLGAVFLAVLTPLFWRWPPSSPMAQCRKVEFDSRLQIMNQIDNNDSNQNEDKDEQLIVQHGSHDSHKIN